MCRVLAALFVIHVQQLVSCQVLVSMAPKKKGAQARSPALQARANKSAAVKASKKKDSKSEPAAGKKRKQESAVAERIGDRNKQKIVPEPTPMCTSCEQYYGANEKELLPDMVPLKWRSFFNKQMEVEGLTGF